MWCGLLLLAAAAQGAFTTGLPPFLGAGGSLTAHPKNCPDGTVWYRYAGLNWAVGAGFRRPAAALAPLPPNVGLEPSDS